MLGEVWSLRECDFRYPEPMGAIFDRKVSKLYIYTWGTTEVWSTWPRPMAWRKSNSDACWRHVRPALALPKRPVAGELRRFHARERDFPYKLHTSAQEELAAKKRGEKLARLEWAETIPDAVRRLVAPFSTRQWHLLSMAARCGDRAMDLIQANPALAFMLASNWVFHQPGVKQPLRSVRALLRPGRKQVDMLAWLGFPPRPAVRRLLARIPPASIDIPRLLYLRDACRDSAALKRLSHLPRLNAGSLRIICDPLLLPHVSHALLVEISQRRQEDNRRFRAARLVGDALQALELVGRTINGVIPANTIAELESFHNDAVDTLNQVNQRVGCAGTVMFPSPPLPGDEAVRPITSASELRAEGVDMKHCVAIHETRIAAGWSYYVYRVVSPERATLGIRRTPSGWMISQLVGRRNSPVSLETRSRVQEWLNVASGKNVPQAFGPAREFYDFGARQ